MSKYTIGRPSQNVRLRNWPAGRVASMRLMISRLEEALNDTLGSQTLQSAAREFNDNIPFILDFTLSSGFRQFEINFTAPPGLGGAGRGVAPHPDRQLLFYEIQHSATQAFTSYISIETPQTHIIAGGFDVGETRYFRARTINTKFQASRWTSTVGATTAQGKIVVTAIDDNTIALTSAIGAWQDVFTVDYEPSAGSTFANVQLALGAPQEDRGSRGGGPAHVQFRWLLDVGSGDQEIEGLRTVMAAVPGNTETSVGKAPMAFGSYMTPFRTLPGSGTVTYTLQARKRPGSEWKGGDGLSALTTADPLIFARNGKIVEILENLV